MTTKLLETLTLAGEAIEEGLATFNIPTTAKIAEALAAIRAALAEQAEQEPVIGAYEVVNEKGDEWSLVYPAAVHRYKSIPEERITQTFYAAPVRTKDLTDTQKVDNQPVIDALIEAFGIVMASVSRDQALNEIEKLATSIRTGVQKEKNK